MFGRSDLAEHSGMSDVSATREFRPTGEHHAHNELDEARAILDAIQHERVDALVVGDAATQRVCLIVDAAKTTERALRHSEDFLRLAVDVAKLGIWRWHLQANVLEASDVCKAHFGLSTEEPFSYEVFLERLHPEDRHRTDAAVHRAIDEQTAYDVEYRTVWPDGTCRHIAAKGRAQYDDGGRPIRLEGVTLDITERKQTEQEWRLSEAQFHTLADNIAQLAWMADEKGNRFWYNQRWFEYTGTTLAEMEGWKWLRVHHPDHVERVDRKIRHCFATGEVWEDTFPLRDKNGNYRWFLARAIPVRDKDGRVLRWFGTDTDITQRLEMEAQLRQSHQRKDEFLAMLGHELRNPLAGIVSGIEVLKMIVHGDPEANQIRDVIEFQATHMARLIDDLLDVSRISRGKIQLRLKPLDLVELVRKTTESVRRIFADSGLRLVVELPAESVWGHGDATRLAQVLGNMLNNAQKFTDAGGAVTVRLEAEPGSRMSQITVRDSGIGMEEAVLRRVFEPFSQADGSLDRSRGGLGLGMALAKGLIEMHGGSVKAFSDGLGKGSTFVVELPRLPANFVTPAPICKNVIPLKPHRILLIDDRRDAVVPLQKMLKLMGQDVAVASDAQSGLRKAREFLPEIVLCDIGLPDMNGYEVAQALRAEQALSSAYLVAATGYGQEDDRRRAVESGFDYHIAKPVSKDQLECMLREFPRFHLAGDTPTAPRAE